jgi:hypothetical protein
MKKIHYIFLFVIIMFLSFPIHVNGQYAINRFDYTWCTTTYPTAFVISNWSIRETATIGQQGFSRNQTNATLIIDLPAGFEFNTAAGASVTADGTELSSISFVYNSVSRITVTLSVSNNNNEFNTLFFNNFQIRATAAVSGNILRTGGTLEIDSDIANPTSAQPFGQLMGGSPFSYTSSAATHPTTANIFRYSINNQILRVRITGTGNCGTNATSFTFSTDGGNGTGTNIPASNLTQAKIYYTGTSTTFSTNKFFGSVASPDGIFTIDGLQELENGDNYFWLVYDVPPDASITAGSNLVDAQIVSFVIGGSTINAASITTPAPAGSRTIVVTPILYTRSDGNWNVFDRWSTTIGGASCSCLPPPQGIAILLHNINLNANFEVGVVEIRDGASLVGNNNLTLNTQLVSFGSGFFETSTFKCFGNVTLNSGSGASSANGVVDIDGDLIVGAGTSLSTSSPGQHIYIGGNLTVNGNLTSGTNSDIYMDGGFTTLSGTGTIAATSAGRMFYVNSGNKTIPASADLTFNIFFFISGPYTITNNGTVTFDLNRPINGNNALSTWTNAASSTLIYRNVSIFATNGRLEASANNNTVVFDRNNGQNLPPLTTKYYNLILSNLSNRVLNSSIEILGNLTINGVVLVAGSYTITLNGAVSQTVSGSATPTFYNLVINNSSGAIPQIDWNITATVSNFLTMNNGVIDLNGRTLTLGTSAANPGLLSHSSGWFYNGNFRRWFSTGTIADGSMTGFYPMGTNLNRRNFYVSAPASGITTGGTITVSHTDPDGGSTAVSFPDDAVTVVNRHNSYWTVIPSGIAGGTYNLRAGGTGLGTVADLNDLRLTLLNSVVGTHGGNSGTTSDFLVFRNGLTLANLNNNFYIGTSGVTPLPVELLSFDAIPGNNSVQLKWITSSEINNDYFEVERTTNGIDYTVVVHAKGAGNSNYVIEYKEEDTNPLIGISYYRLVQYDFDGTASHSDLVPVNFSTQLASIFNVYPNPLKTNQTLNLFFKGKKDQEILVVVRDQLGREHYSKVLVLPSDEEEVFVIDPVKKLIPGIYLITGTSNNDLFHKKLIVK